MMAISTISSILGLAIAVLVWSFLRIRWGEIAKDSFHAEYSVVYGSAQMLSSERLPEIYEVQSLWTPVTTDPCHYP